MAVLYLVVASGGKGGGQSSDYDSLFPGFDTTAPAPTRTTPSTPSAPTPGPTAVSQQPSATSGKTEARPPAQQPQTTAVPLPSLPTTPRPTSSTVLPLPLVLTNYTPIVYGLSAVLCSLVLGTSLYITCRMVKCTCANFDAGRHEQRVEHTAPLLDRHYRLPPTIKRQYRRPPLSRAQSAFFEEVELVDLPTGVANEATDVLPPPPDSLI